MHEPGNYACIAGIGSDKNKHDVNANSVPAGGFAKKLIEKSRALALFGPFQVRKNRVFSLFSHRFFFEVISKSLRSLAIEN